MDRLTQPTYRKLSDVTSSSFNIQEKHTSPVTPTFARHGHSPHQLRNNGIHDYSFDFEDISANRYDATMSRTSTRNRPILGIAGDQYFTQNSLFQSEAGVMKIRRPVYSQNKFNELYEEHITEGRTMRFLDNVFMPRKEKRQCSEILWSIFPLVNVIRHYSFKKSLPFDFLSGLTTGVMRIPQSMAYGLLAFLPPAFGLYTAFFSAIFYPIFGGSPHMVAGAQGVVSLIIGDGVTKFADNTTHISVDSELENKIDVAVTITFMIGLIQCLLGICHFGFLTNYLSDPLIGGFTTAAAVTVLVSQMPVMMGISTKTYSGALNVWYSLIDLFSNIEKTNYATLIISMFCLVFLIVCKYLTSKFIKKIKVPVPGELMIMIALILFSYLMNIEKRWKVHLVGKIELGFPRIRLPTIGLFLKTISVSFSGAIVSFAIGYSISKRLAVKNDYEINGNREVFAFGFMNCLGSFFNIFAATASMSASSLHESLGGVSQLANYFASILVLFTFLYIGKLFEPVPECVLSTVILINLKSILFQFRDLKTLWKMSKFDFLLWIVTFIAVIMYDINTGLIIGVAFSLLTVVFRTQWPYSCLLGRIPSTDIYKNISLTPDAEEIDGIKIFRFEGSLYFASAEHFRNAIKHTTGINPTKLIKAMRERETKLFEVKEQAAHFFGQEPSSSSTSRSEIVDIHSQEVHHMIIDFSTCSFIDSVGVRTLVQVMHDFKAAQITVFLASVKSAVRAMLIGSSVMHRSIDTDQMYITTHDAVLAALKDEKYLEERNFLIQDATMKSNMRFISRIASDTDLQSRRSHNSFA